MDRYPAGASAQAFPAPAGRVPPHSLEAERSVLGGILIDNTAIDRIIDVNLAADDFYKEAHRLVFRSLFELHSRGEPADLVTITNALRSGGNLEKCGGASYLSSLVEQEFSAANVPHHARIVREKAILRRLINANAEISSEAFTGVEDQEQFLEEVEKKIFEITDQKSSHAFDPVKEILLRNFQQIEELAQKKDGLTGVPSGFPDLDRETSGFQQSQLIIIAARPGMGKTSLMLNMALASAEATKLPVAMFSMEMSKEELTMRLLATESEVDSHRLKTGRLQEPDWKKLQRAAGKLAECPIFIDDTPALNVFEIKSRARRLQSLHGGLSLVMVDYLQLSRGTTMRGNQANREQEIAEISRGLKALAKELRVPVIAASQLNRGVENRQDKRPMLSDLRESGAIEQDADIVLFIHREEQYQKGQVSPDEKGMAELIIGKHRAGSVGTVKLTWIGQYTKFKSYSGADAPHGMDSKPVF